MKVMAKDERIKWMKKPNDTNYPAALSYLSLIFDEKTAKKFVARLKKKKVVNFKSKDIFRASKLSLLGISNAQVDKNLKKIHDGIALSPILLVRNIKDGTVIVADGYHRMCAVYSFDENEEIPCQIV